MAKQKGKKHLLLILLILFFLFLFFSNRSTSENSTNVFNITNFITNLFNLPEENQTTTMADDVIPPDIDNLLPDMPPTSESQNNCFDGIDNDNDGLTDIFDPDCFGIADEDTDGDGWSNGDEYEQGFNLNDPLSFPGSCKDSDGNDPLAPGTVLSAEGTFTDSCETSTSVREYYCVDGRVQSQVHQCPPPLDPICDGGTEKFCQS